MFGEGVEFAGLFHNRRSANPQRVRIGEEIKRVPKASGGSKIAGQRNLKEGRSGLGVPKGVLLSKRSCHQRGLGVLQLPWSGTRCLYLARS
jgi:hypothetical protein